MLIIRGTRKFLDRVGGPTAAPEERLSTALGDWYATLLLWRPQVALFVNELSLLPVLVPFAPAATVRSRLVDSVSEAFAAHALPGGFVSTEVAAMTEARFAKTASRSVVGIMNEFTYLANADRQSARPRDLLDLSMWLSRTPCSPLYKSHTSPDRELSAVVQGLSPRDDK